MLSEERAPQDIADEMAFLTDDEYTKLLEAMTPVCVCICCYFANLEARKRGERTGKKKKEERIVLCMFLLKLTNSTGRKNSQKSIKQMQGGEWGRKTQA